METLLEAEYHNVLERTYATFKKDAIAVSAAYNEALDLQTPLTTFSASDFGRTLTPNGNGTDHAWGGNQFVVGGAVDGGKVFGEYPELALGSLLDTGRGRFVPTTSVDQFAADLALWMGVSPRDLPLVLPNLAGFHDVIGNGPPLRLMRVS